MTLELQGKTLEVAPNSSNISTDTVFSLRANGSTKTITLQQTRFPTGKDRKEVTVRTGETLDPSDQRAARVR